MEATYSEYFVADSAARIEEILKGKDSEYDKEQDGIPARSSLTYDNGYYVNCTALFIDIRKSQELAERHSKAVLAKIYRSFISECVAVMRGTLQVEEVYIEGDCVWAIFNTTLKAEIDSAFHCAYRLNTLIKLLNKRYQKYGYSNIQAGIGIDYGSALYIKAGHKGSGINEVVWLGQVVGRAAQLSSYASQGWADKAIMASRVIYNNLNDDNKKLLSWNENRSCYHGDIIEIGMNEWVENNS